MAVAATIASAGMIPEEWALVRVVRIIADYVTVVLADLTLSTALAFLAPWVMHKALGYQFQPHEKELAIVLLQVILTATIAAGILQWGWGRPVWNFMESQGRWAEWTLRAAAVTSGCVVLYWTRVRSKRDQP